MRTGAGNVAQWVKLPPVASASHIPYPISHIPAVPFPIQLSANMPGKAAEDSPSSWVPVTHVADPEVPGS